MIETKFEVCDPCSCFVTVFEWHYISHIKKLWGSCTSNFPIIIKITIIIITVLKAQGYLAEWLIGDWDYKLNQLKSYQFSNVTFWWEWNTWVGEKYPKGE